MFLKNTNKLTLISKQVFYPNNFCWTEIFFLNEREQLMMGEEIHYLLAYISLYGMCVT